MSTLRVNAIQNASGTDAISIGSDGSLSYPNIGRRNLVINGAMQVAQRGTSAFDASTYPFPVDRFRAGESTSASSVTAQQVSDAPAGFLYSIKYTVGTGGTATGTQQAYLRYKVEGQDVQHLNWGSSDAQTITISFRVKSSVAGTFCVGILNNAQDRAIASEYTINSANTWETKTVTILGDTSGTWLTTNGVGLDIHWSLGAGSDFYNAAADTWEASNNYITSNQTDLIGTSGATFYLTGVQLEVGSVATPFEHRSYGEELALCQRYFEVLYCDSAQEALFSADWNGSQHRAQWFFKVEKRTAATFSLAPTAVWDPTPTSVQTSKSKIGAYHNSYFYLRDSGSGGNHAPSGYADAEL